MNIIDLALFLVLGLFVLIGMHKGLVRSALNVCGYIVSFILAAIVYPILSKLLFLNKGLVKSLRFYAEGAEKLASVESAALEVASLSKDQIRQLVTDSVAKVNGGLRAPLDSKVLSNLNNLAFRDEFTTVGEYFNETIVRYTFNILAFIICFFIIKLIINIILGIYTSSNTIPRLRQYDSLFAGVFGLVEGMLIMAMLFSIMPLVYNIMVIKPIEDLLKTSLLGNLFINANIIPSIIRSVV